MNKKMIDALIEEAKQETEDSQRLTATENGKRWVNFVTGFTAYSRGDYLKRHASLSGAKYQEINEFGYYETKPRL